MSKTSAKFWYHVSFRVRNAGLFHDKLTTLLGVPTHCHKKEDGIFEKPQEKRKYDMWVISKEEDGNDDLIGQMSFLENLISCNKDFLKELHNNGIYMDIFLSYDCSEEGLGFGIDAKYLQCFSECGISLQVSILPR